MLKTPIEFQSYFKKLIQIIETTEIKSLKPIQIDEFNLNLNNLFNQILETINTTFNKINFKEDLIIILLELKANNIIDQNFINIFENKYITTLKNQLQFQINQIINSEINAEYIEIEDSKIKVKYNKNIRVLKTLISKENYDIIFSKIINLIKEYENQVIELNNIINQLHKLYGEQKILSNNLLNNFELDRNSLIKNNYQLLLNYLGINKLDKNLLNIQWNIDPNISSSDILIPIYNFQLILKDINDKTINTNIIDKFWYELFKDLKDPKFPVLVINTDNQNFANQEYFKYWSQQYRNYNENLIIYFKKILNKG